jgi:hypothetical protein
LRSSAAESSQRSLSRKALVAPLAQVDRAGRSVLTGK